MLCGKKPCVARKTARAQKTWTVICVKFKKWGPKLGLLLLCAVVAAASTGAPAGAIGLTGNGGGKSGYIKWMTFDIPAEALRKALRLDIASHGTDCPLPMADLVAYLGAKYGGNWKRYREKDMDALAASLRSGQSIAELTKNMKHYPFFRETYGSVIGNFVGEYAVEVPNGDGGKTMRKKYGLKVFSPIARGYGYGHYRDFGDSRTFGFRRPHLGNDLLGTIGTPVVAVESGTVEVLGWNRYGGWRIGIRSFDSRRSYYYAHLRGKHPYAGGLRQGSVVKAGDVVGYLGMTGYSSKEGVSNMKVPHLHFGMQIIFDESQKEGTNQIWIDVYDIVDLLSSNRVQVKRDDTTKDYRRVYDYIDLRYRDHFKPSSGAEVNAPARASQGIPG